MDATKELVGTPGDSAEWIVQLSSEERDRLGSVAMLRLTVVGNVNMAAFYAMNVYGWPASTININEGNASE